MTVLEEMGRLIRSVPGPRASATQLAHWYELKAHMLEQLAVEDEGDSQTALRQAEAAHRRAAALVASRPGG